MNPLLLLLLPNALAGSLSGADAPENLQEAYQSKRVALLVGVDNYSDAELNDLAYAGKDARDLAHALQENGNFDTLMVLDKEEATGRIAILRALDEITADLQRDDTFLLYVSGHGTLTIDTRVGTKLWFLPSDASLKNATDTGIDIAWLEDRVAQVNARRRVLIMDTCHNGRDKSYLAPATAKLLAGLRGDPPPPRSFKEVSESEARLYAAQYYQPAMEDPDLQNGVYTHFLLEAIQDGAEQADLNGDGLVNVAEAHDWARDKTIAHTGGMQVPRAEYRIVGREEIYLSGSEATRNAAERALLTAQDAILAKGRVIVDGRPRGVLPELIAIEPGLHTIEVTDQSGRRLMKRRVRVRAGETLMLEDLFVPRRAGWEVLGGLGLREGAGADILHPFSARLELNRYDFVELADWLELGAHGRLAYARGTLADQGPYVHVDTGEFSVGLSAGLRLFGGLAVLGPELDLALPWRVFTDTEGLHRQANLTPAPGARAQIRIPLKRQHVTLSYSARLIPFAYDGSWERFTEQTVALGYGKQD
jgi:uncharacterized caspase-like protein